MAEVHIDGAPDIGIDEEAISRWIEGRLNDARNIFIRQMSRGGSGRTYRRHGRVYHTASLPGEYPVTDEGRLVGSVDTEMVDTRQGAIFSNVRYAHYLTEGTATMAARRMLGDALNEALEQRPATDALARAARVK